MEMKMETLEKYTKLYEGKAKELDSASFMGAEVKTEYLGVAVVALLAIIIGFRYCTKTLTKGK